jgi:hypothetical protein
MVIVAGDVLVDALSAETKSRCEHRGSGYASDQLCALQSEQAGRGICGAEIVCSSHGYSVRYDSGLQNFGILASGRRGDLGSNTLAEAEAWCRLWVAKDPSHRYAWRRKSEEERRAPLNVLEQAVASNDGDHAVKLIMDALGIVSGDVAGYSMPRTWPKERADRAVALGEWLKTELAYIADDQD